MSITASKEGRQDQFLRSQGERLAALISRAQRLVYPKAAAETVVVPAEAVVALEALAHSLGSTRTSILSVESGRYSATVSSWCQYAGSTVITMPLDRGEVVSEDSLRQAFFEHPEISVVLFAQGEIASGVAQPVDMVAEVAHAHGAIVAVDSVAALGGLPAPTAADIVVFGLQKALGGPSTMSFVSATTRGWDRLNADASTGSILSLSALRAHNQAVIAGELPSTLPDDVIDEALGLLDRLTVDSLSECQARHARATAALRAGIESGGLNLVYPRPEQANTLATSVELPSSIAAAEVVRLSRLWGGHWKAGTHPGDVYVAHFGRSVEFSFIITEVVALMSALRGLGHSVRLGEATEAVSDTWNGRGLGS